MRQNILSAKDDDFDTWARENPASFFDFVSLFKHRDPQECYYYSAEKCGFESNSERTEGTYSKYSSIDDVLDYLHWYTTFIKFGIGHATHDASQEIRNDKITREEAVSLVRKYDGELPESMMKKILNYLDINQEKFDMLTDKSRSPHLWEKNGNCWKLKFQVE